MRPAGEDPERAQEFAAAVITARAYLEAVGVLGGGGTHKTVAGIWDAITRPGAVEMSADPHATEAVILAARLLRGVRETDSLANEALDVLLDKEGRHPAHREALGAVLSQLMTDNPAIPEKLAAWGGRFLPGAPDAPGRKPYSPRLDAARRNHLIGMVVEAMVRGTGTLVRFPTSRSRQLDEDMRKIFEAAAPKSVPKAAVVERLNAMKHRPWREMNDGNGLSMDGLTELLKQQKAETPAIHGIMTAAAVRAAVVLLLLNAMKHRPWREMNDGNGLSMDDLSDLDLSDLKDLVRKFFPNLTPTRSESTEHGHSLCDAVAQALSDGRQATTHRAVKEAWVKYRRGM